MFQKNDFSPLISHINERLSDMITQYIPRYLCTFLNSKVQNCELIFGISDSGEVTGILMDTSIQENHIKE